MKIRQHHRHRIVNKKQGAPRLHDSRTRKGRAVAPTKGMTRAALAAARDAAEILNLSEVRKGRDEVQ